MDREWKHLKIVKDFFQIQEDGGMPEGSRLLLEAMELKTFQAGLHIRKLTEPLKRLWQKTCLNPGSDLDLRLQPGP